MFKYTHDYIILVKKYMRIIDTMFGIISAITMIIYPIFAIIVHLGNFYINLTVLILSFIYFLCITFIKNRKRTFASIYKWIRVLLSAIALGINFYSVYISATNTNGLSIILSCVMVICFILKIAVNIIYDLFVPKLELIYMCVIEDLKPVARIVDPVMKTFTRKPLFGFGDEETPDELKKMLLEVGKELEKEQERGIQHSTEINFIKLVNNEKFEDRKDANLTNLISKFLNSENEEILKNVLINKDEFYRYQYSHREDKNLIEDLLSKGPKKSNVTFEEFSNLINEIVSSLKLKLEINNFKYLSDVEAYDFQNNNHCEKIMIDIVEVLKATQSIYYLYGFKQLKKSEIDEDILRILTLCFSIAIDDENATEVKEELYKSRFALLEKIALKNLIKYDDSNKDEVSIYTKIIQNYTNKNIDIINSFADFIELSN